MTIEDLRRLPTGSALVYRDGALVMTVYLAESHCRRCGRVKVRSGPRGGQWWLVFPHHLERA